MTEEYYVKEDVYGKNGVLLVGKGQKITKEVMEKLKKIGVYKPAAFVPENGEPEIHEKFDVVQGAVTSGIVHAFKERLKIRDERLLEYPNKVLNTIIFDSKSKPWWIFVNALSNYIDWVYTHSIDVAIISMMLAKELGYNDEELWNIGLGSFLHDIGKLLVPRSILQKPGALTNEEMMFVKQHCELGADSLNPYNLARDCTDIVLHHHERLDGSGYPHGLGGSEIGLNARIVMVADAVDAITTSRPYKHAEEIGAAVKILKDEGGKYPQELILLLENMLE